MDAVHTGVCTTDIDVVFILSQCFFPSRFVFPNSMRFQFAKDGADVQTFDCARIFIRCYSLNIFEFVCLLLKLLIKNIYCEQHANCERRQKIINDDFDVVSFT